MLGNKADTPALGSRTIVAFVATVDPVRAKAFYSGALSLRLVAENQFA